MKKPPIIGNLVFADDDSCSMCVIDYYLDDFNYLEVAEGKYEDKELPESVKIFVGGPPCDYLGNPLSWNICSNRLAEHFKDDLGANVRVLRAPLYYKNGVKIDGYSIVMPQEVVKCLDYEKSVFLGTHDKDKVCIEQTIRVDDIPTNTKIFFVEDCHWSTFFTQESMASLIGKGFTGMAFIECEVS